MASLPSIQQAGACRSTPGRPAAFLQPSCSHRVTPFTSRTRKLPKRSHIKQCVPWSTNTLRRSTTRVYAAEIEESQPEDAAAEEAEIIAEEENEIEALLEDDEFKPHSVVELSEEQLKDRAVLLSTIAKSTETKTAQLTAEQEEDEQTSRDLAATIVDAALELEQKFGGLRAAGAGKENPLPFSDDAFWQEVDDDVETIQMVEDFDDTKVSLTDPFFKYIVSSVPPKPLSSDAEFHNDADIAALRNATVDADTVVYTDEEKAVLSSLEGEALEEEEDDTPPVLEALTALLGVPQAPTEEEKLAAQEAASEAVADASDLLADKEFANVVDIAALASGLSILPEEQAQQIKWVANKLTSAAEDTTYSDVVATASASAQEAADAGELQQADLDAFKALLQDVSGSLGADAGSKVALGEGFASAISTALAALKKDGFVDATPVDDSAVAAFLAEHQDQLQELEAIESAFSQLALPDQHSAREQSQNLLFKAVADLEDPEITAAALATEISVADAAAAKEVFLQEAKAVLSADDFSKVKAYVQSAFLAKVRDSGTPSDAEPEIPTLQFPEIDGLDIGDDEADKVQPDFSKIAAQVDDADDYELDDFDEDVVKWRHVKAELLKSLLQGEEEAEDGSAPSELVPEDGASAASLKTLMQLIEDAAEGRELLKDFQLPDSDVDGEPTFPSVAAALAKIKEGGDVAADISDSPLLQRLVPLLKGATAVPSVESPTFTVEVPTVPEHEEAPLDVQDLYEPIEDFTNPVINQNAVAADLAERIKIRQEREAELGVHDQEPSDDEFEADDKEKALLAQLPAVTPELVEAYVKGDGYVDLGAPEVDLEAALAKAEAAAKAFAESTSGLDDPSGLSDEDVANLKTAFDNLYLVKAAISPEAAELKAAAEKVRAELLAHRFADSIREFVESTITRGHLDDLNLLKIDDSALEGLDVDQADQAITDLVDKLAAVGEDKLVAAAEEAVKDLGEVDVAADGPIPDDIAEQFEAAVVEKVGAQRLGELKAEAEINALLENPRLLGLNVDPQALAAADDLDPTDPLYELKLLEESGVVPPAVEEDAEETDAAPATEAVAVAEDAEAVEEDAEEITPPSAEGAILGDLVDQVIESLQKVDDDDLYFDDEVYDADADAEASAEQEAEVDEDEYAEDEDDEEVTNALDGAVDVEDDDDELDGLVYTDAAAKSAEVQAEDDLDEYGEEEGEGDVAPEDMRNEYNSFLSEELFGNPTFADIWEEMGIPEMRPKDPVRMDQEDYSANASTAQDDEEEEAEIKASVETEEGEDDLKDVPIGNWFGDEDGDEDLGAIDADDADEETSLEKLSKYYGTRQSFEGLEQSDAPRADLDVFSGSTYVDGADTDDRAADDTSGLMERVTVTKEGVVFIERVIQVQRVTKVVKGGNIMSFRCTAVVGNRAGIVGVGVGSAREVAKAVQKAVADAKKNVIMVPLTKYSSIPHRVEKKFKASQCVINPAADGTGCIAGGAIRSVLELAGVKNCLAKQLGTRNPMNNAKLTIEALKDLQTWGEVAAKRNVPIEYLFAQNQDEADRVLAEHRSGFDEEIY